MSWNPSPTIGSASWQGNPPLITKNQFLSTVAQLQQDLLNTSTFSVSTLIVPNWISTSFLNVSTLRAENLDVSGIVFDASGILFAPLISSQSASINNITNVSVMQFAFKPTFTGAINVSFDLGLGQAIGGFLAGLGAAVGGAFIGVGTALGLTIQGAEQGIATMIAGRPQNFINNTTYETINFTSQLQVSTLGNAYPLYSSIFRTVSSASANSAPGPELFTSSFFLPGQICIRSVSDPFNLISGDSNLNTSTIQSFGQWVPLEGLEPENIVCNGVEANTISTGNFYSVLAKTDVLESYTVVASNFGIGLSAFLNYQAPLGFQTGATNQAAFVGNLNNLYCYNDTNYIFSSQPGSTQENASLYLGQNADESLLNVSSIFSRGNIQANSGYFSTLQVEQLLVISSLSTIFTQSNVNVISTSIIDATSIFAKSGVFSTIQTSSLSQFSFGSPLGNPTGLFDITKQDSIVSTAYDEISSLTQNILSYSLNAVCQDQVKFSAWTPTAPIYTVSPSNVQQWGSTMLICNPGADIGGQLAMTFSTSWQQANLTGQFDLTVDMTQQAFSMSAVQYAAQSPGGGYLNTFFYQPPTNGFFKTWRFTVDTTGVWSAVTPAPAPPITSNNNTFQIYQDINDTYISATDRLHIQAGDILLEGALNLGDFVVQNLNVQYANINSTFAQNIQVSTIASQQFQDTFNFTGGYNIPGSITPLNFQYNLNSTDFTNIRTLTVPSRGPNMFNSLNVNEWNNTQYNQPLGTNATSGGPQIYLGDLRTTPTPYTARFWINNTTSPPIPFPIYVVKQPGSWLSTLGAAVATGTGVTLIQTIDGVNWSLLSNATNPQGIGGFALSNQYNLVMNEQITQLTNTMPYTEVTPTKTTIANKVMMAANQIRTLTYSSPSFPSREAGFELSTYFDSNVIFTGTQSDAVNNIISPYGSLGYPVVAWSPQLWFGRIRTATLGIQGFEISAVVVLISGTFADFIWASARYLNCASDGTADIREIYFMVPFNYMTNEYLVGPY
jgi:hypothetical protein